MKEIVATRQKYPGNRDHWNRYYFALLLFVILIPIRLSGIEDEYYRKAALFKAFTQYIQWPAESEPESLSKPFTIAVIGKNPFGTILENAYSPDKNRIKDKLVEIRYIESPQEIAGCHILFIAKSVDKELEDILTVTRGKPILTIAEKKGFAQKGVLFNLYVAGGEIRFEINVTALRGSGLVVDSQLLSVAKIVQPESNVK